MQQDILAANSDSNVRVYAVWFNMLPKDSRGGFPTELLTDSRVTQFWDENHLAGQAFAPLADWHKGVLWDAYFLYGPNARWPTVAAASPPSKFQLGLERPRVTVAPALPRPASWGRTIFSTRDQLKRDFDNLAAK